MKVLTDIKKKIAAIIKRRRQKRNLENIFKECNVKLPDDYKFDREEIHSR